MKEIIDKIRRFEQVAVAKAISSVENRENRYEKLLGEVHKYAGSAVKIGFTGPPGVGKSTLVSKVAQLLSSQGRKVSILAIDPSSPFTGGAILGDRVRMSDLGESISIRSMATRGTLGGLASATNDAADILDAAGSDFILIETVGVGQQEIEVARFTDCVVLVISPESGDSIQMLKAGILEAADLIVVNKSDRPNADRIVLDVENSLHLGKKSDIKICKTVAVKGQGVNELVDNIKRFLDVQKSSGKFSKRRDEILKNKLKIACFDHILRTFNNMSDLDKKLEKSVKAIKNSKSNLYNEVEKIVEEFANEAGSTHS